MINTLDTSIRGVKNAVSKCQSSSGIAGAELRKSHYKLGIYIAENLIQKEGVKGKNVLVIVLLRSGLPFGLGVADGLEIDNHVTMRFSNEKGFSCGAYDAVILADAVINTGKTTLKLLDTINNPNTFIATTVISQEGIEATKNLKVYAARTSSHSYTGSAQTTITQGKGPDTGDRLFNSSFFGD